ncbi:MAG: hypothetical protein LUF29_10290, partial [Oscillospiraceae bacterium]|nr:hypothetical protein [Oscillospiraceae bacterium]
EYYRYIVYVSPTQFDTTITATLTDSSTTISVSDYSVYQYCEAAITSDESDELYAVKDLCEAVLVYGYYAEIYAGEENSTLPGNLTTILGSDWLTTNDVVTWDNPEIEAISSDPDVTKYLALDGNGIYVIFEVTDTASIYTVNGETLEVQYDNGTYYIEYRVPAKEMNRSFSVFRDGEVYTTYSVYTYVKHIIDTGVSAEYSITEDAINLCKAIYNYGEAASDFTGWR